MTGSTQAVQCAERWSSPTPSVYKNGFRQILEAQVKATLYLNAMLDQEWPVSSAGTLKWAVHAGTLASM
jgi:hypothetical protein